MFFIFIFDAHRKTTIFPYYEPKQNKLSKKRKTALPTTGSIYPISLRKNPNSDRYKVKASPVLPVGALVPITSAISLQESEEALDKKASCIECKRSSGMMDKNISGTDIVKRTASLYVANQSENAELFPSDVAQEAQKVLAIRAPVNIESQLERYFKPVHPSSSFQFPVTYKYGRNRKRDSTMFKRDPVMTYDKTNDKIKCAIYEGTINDQRFRACNNCEGVEFSNGSINS